MSWTEFLKIFSRTHFLLSLPDLPISVTRDIGLITPVGDMADDDNHTAGINYSRRIQNVEPGDLS